MAYVSVLKEVEDFLRSDLAGERLSAKVKSKKNSILTKVSKCINDAEQEKIDKFLDEQREISRREENNNIKTPLSEDYYMDLTEVGNGPPPVTYKADKKLSVVDDGGSGSGYESYNSDEESSTRQKKYKEEDLTAYFSTAGCDIYSYIYLEIKGNFLTGKKWAKRIGIVKENHLKCFKKPSDTAAVLDIPMRSYNATLKSKEGTSSTIIVLSAGSDSDAHRYYVERDKIDEWVKVLKEKTLGVTDTRGVPAPPPVSSRPTNTLPRMNTQEHIGTAKQGVQRSASVGVGDRSKSVGDINILISDFGNPPVPPGHPSISPTAIQLCYIGKGLKSAVSDMFKKDKVKKRITMAENLGAAVCGYLLVYDKNWVKKWCLVKNNQLLIYGKEESPELQIELQGCDLLPYSDDSERQFGFKILKNGKEVIYMEAGSSDEMGKWVGVLIAETGLAEIKMSEPEYMSIEMRKSVMSTAKQAFLSRKDRISRKEAGNSVFFKEEEEDLYIDFTAQSPPINKTPTEPEKEKNKKAKKTQDKPKSPDTAPPSGKTTVEASTEKDGKTKKAKKTLSQSSSNESKAQPSDKAQTTDKISQSNDKKEKQKDKKKEKEERRLSTPPTLIEAKSNRVDGALSLPAKSTTLTESKEDVRKKEIPKEKAEIKTKLLTLRVKKEELNKYIEASKNDKELGRLRVMLSKVSQEHSALEKEDVALELELRKIKDGVDIDSPSNKRPPRPEKKPITTGASGNVMKRAQMWESGGKK